MHTYCAYGLGIHSTLELPELATASLPADLVVRAGPVPRPVGDGARPPVVLRFTPEEAVLRWPEMGTVAVRGGREIVVDARPGVDARTLRLYVLGPALALALHQRGLLVLHASAVELGGGTVAFLGASGRGKSTTAAALHARGHPLVADDVVGLDLDHPAGPLALAAFPQLKLWPDAVAALGGDAEAHPRVHPAEAKVAWRADALATRPLPLRRCYVLADADAVTIEPLDGHPALFELVQHSYVAPALALVGRTDILARCARLAGMVPVRRLARPRALDALDALAALVEAEAAREGSGAPTAGPRPVSRPRGDHGSGDPTVSS